MKLTTTPDELKQGRRDKLAKKVLSDRYIKLNVNKEFNIKGDLQGGVTKVYCKINLTGSATDSEMFIEGTGAGPVDAFFSSLVGQLSKQFCSLNLLRFSEFGISADLSRIRLSPSGSDAPVEAVLVVSNELDRQFIFRERSCSMNRAALGAVIQAVEHFINSEEAVIALHHAIADAKKRNRGDLMDRYMGQLSELVERSSYESTIAKRTYNLKGYKK